MTTFDREIDTSGLNCPLPLLKTKKMLNTMTVGERVKVIATDKSAYIDIPVYCEMSEHILIDQSRTEELLTFIIEKG